MMNYSAGSKVIDILKNVSKKTKSKVAKELMMDKEFEAACSAAHQLFDEMMEEVREGEMEWKEAVNDLRGNLLAVDMPEYPEAKEEREEDEE
jgi:hypothetical protein